MRFDILTLFPSMVEFYVRESIIKRAIEAGIVDIVVTNIRDYAIDKHKCVDDYPYGGGAGMVMKIDPVYEALQDIKQGRNTRTILLSPQGTIFNQGKAEELFENGTDIALICGRYEGIDERIKYIVDEEISVGDYVLTGGELPALIIVDTVCRLVPGVLGDERSSREDSFSCGILDYPHYTRPPDYKGYAVPSVLLSGNHEKIRMWRRKEALKRTLKRKPSLIEENDKLSKEDYILLKMIKEEEYDIDECGRRAV
ncbi:MAG: tRNA (guanosine(37)-N1)-methyltransferase TrmD [Candidatus Magnetoovum sp. WYHC-5]|nr:tRNA (guanosine(37)-N1)-methyltransferase TrmD [Candidatus Magnetoovum sp. WYHC-5]